MAAPPGDGRALWVLPYTCATRMSRSHAGRHSAQGGADAMTENEPSIGRARTLKDGRHMAIRLATLSDVPEIAQQHMLPQDMVAPEKPYRTYFRGKAWLYITTPEIGVMTGWVDGALAGFLFFSANHPRLQRAMRSCRTMMWALAQLVSGQFGGPRLWIDYARAALSHFRSPNRYRSAQTEDLKQQIPNINAWISHVQTSDGFRRLGVASALIDVTEQLLRLQGADVVALTTLLDNRPAIQLYEKHGYVKATRVGHMQGESWLMVKEMRATR